MPKTMSHTPARRKAWHDGKKKQHEGLSGFIRRVYNNGANFRGAHTPAFFKRGIYMSKHK